MKLRNLSKVTLLLLTLSAGCSRPAPLDGNMMTAGNRQSGDKSHFAVVHTEAQWRKLLSPDQYNILREAGTEPAYHNPYWDNHAKGTYYCAACGQELFSSSTKFDSGTGWPSFWAPVDRHHVILREDDSDGMTRTEVICAHCGSHLGHVFDDGPRPTGQRYCMNSIAMTFKPGSVRLKPPAAKVKKDKSAQN